MPRQKSEQIPNRLLQEWIREYSIDEAREKAYRYLRLHQEEVRLCLAWERERENVRSKLLLQPWPSANMPYPLYRAIRRIAHQPVPKRPKPKGERRRLTAEQKTILQRILPPRCLEVFELRVKGFSVSQISDQLGITRAAVNAHIRRATKAK